MTHTKPLIIFIMVLALIAVNAFGVTDLIVHVIGMIIDTFSLLFSAIYKIAYASLSTIYGKIALICAIIFTIS
ncbi:hypothetical protein, partial [Pseudomonas aeruginosa]|uniref:hypothetical protein n=1 Tax=Pseudomonas aeruginosa TaxID=287 RepID=UPI002341F201